MNKNIIIVLFFLSSFMVHAQKSIGTPNPSPSAILELKSTVKGFLPPRLTTLERDAIISAPIGLLIYNTNKNCIEWYDGKGWFNGCGNQDSSGGSAIVSGYNCATASSGTLTRGTAIAGVSQTITATVDKIGFYSITASANGVTFSGSGTFTATGSQDIVLIAAGTPIVAETSNFVLNTTPTCSFSRITTVPAPVSGGAICDGSAPTTVVPITSSTKRIWMDRNLGASRAGITVDDYEAFGCLYQWGRGNDGHASTIWSSSTAGLSVNGTTTVLATTDTPADALFITNNKPSFDWRSPQNFSLWQGLKGKNNPCPDTYRVPTNAELTDEVTAYNISGTFSAFASPHKFVTANYRDGISGALDNSGLNGYYWSSTISGQEALARSFGGGGTNDGSAYTAYGLSVRCIKD